MMCLGVFCEFWDIFDQGLSGEIFLNLKLPVGSEILGFKSGGDLDA